MKEFLKRLSIKKKRRAVLDARNGQTRLHSLYRLELALTSTLNLQGRLDILLEHTMKQMRADIAAVFLIDPIANDLAVIAQRGAKHFGSGYGFRLKVGEGAAGWIAQHKQPLAIPNVHEEARWLCVEQSETENIFSYLGVPLVVDGETIGVLDVATCTRRVFDREDIEFFETLAGRAAISIKNAQMVEELRLYKNALNSAADAVAITNLQGQILDVNPSFERLTGYSRAESIGRNMSIVKSRHSTKEFYRKMWEEILTDGHWIGEVVNRRKDGEEWRSWNAISTVQDESGKPIAYVGVNRDITALKEAESALRRRTEELALVNQISTVINQPLALADVLTNALCELTRVLGLDHGMVAVSQGSPHELTIIAECKAEGRPSSLGVKIPLTARKYASRVVGDAPPLLHELGSQSALMVPLVSQDQTIGGIGLGSVARPREFTPDEIALVETIAHQAAAAIEKARLFDAERTRREELAALYNLSRALADTAYDTNAILELVARHAVETVHVTFARTVLFKNEKSIMHHMHPIRSLEGEPREIVCDPLDSMPICFRASQQNNPVILQADNPELVEAERTRLFPGSTRTICLVPLRVADRFLGFLVLGEERREHREPFNPDKVRLARSIGDQAASALNRAELFIELEESYLQTVFALVNAVDAKDTYTANHAQQLTVMALAVGREMGLSSREMEDLRYGAILHDIGKIGIPDAILQKPTHLGEEEWKWMRQHPEIGARILAPIPRLSGAARIVLHHHERVDGSGYPNGLSGEAIPLVARILTVVDAYNAILDVRAYKPSRSKETAVAELKEHSGTQFDSCVVDVFLRVLEREFS